MEKLANEKMEDKVAFITKAMTCKFNELWKCQHEDNKGNACVEVCKNYKHGKEV
jgi:hypothetical protein